MRISDWSSDVCSSDLPGPIRYHCPPVALSGPPVTLSGAAAPSGSRTAKRKMMKHNDFLRAAAALTVTLGLAAAPHAVSAQEASPFAARQSEALARRVQPLPLAPPAVLVGWRRRDGQQKPARDARPHAEA